MGGDHGHHKYEVPDYRIYKIEDCPKLVKVQKALAQKGLKDPWLRNEVWRFQPAFKTEGYRARLTFFRGIQWGFAAFLATIAIEKVWETMSPSDHSHGHH
ncbi:NADH dehydrogenase [ubiquinone] 1 beta subcomplex subunit 3 [Cryptotermes secundus]|uniref:NADH dehydrogenase [ubiquinone] 1 beta subcomplex subunit 3 n=1 Tax=Cryptotermes secundus TaxID=105785 RepID=A0A2J7R4H6_9NEOP|nr:NADH dehydrogenase [ubiquinone] 1 beta subcomplex subunit 3 [Cryptotermes secundus]XP_023705555.1 NADH dehydrogenase [ubiquinone] 1 beta subcomplex subunit 3 [Cryptotermes secundus]PNF35715.1 NADH dehydrogenase [ubiquinone] 1 beta subcomplex subunit 3 [Cryptotermes secundus]